MLKPYLAGVGLVAALTCVPAIAQKDAGQAVPQMVQGNERFGRKLLQQVHLASPTSNVVVAPLSLSIMLAALQSNSQWEVSKEIAGPFGWQPYSLSIPARMLTARFEKPVTEPCPPAFAAKKQCPKPEGVWITNTFLYRLLDHSQDPLSPYFVRSAAKDFGFKFTNIGMTAPTQKALRKAQKSTRPLPGGSPANDAWISSGVHIQARWSGNTFSMSHPHPSQFLTAAGISREVQVLDSELSSYFHATTDSFEAIALPCSTVYMIAVLPNQGRDIRDIERQLVEQPDALDVALKKEVGLVTIPTFHMVFQSDLRPSIEALNIKSVFQDLGELVKIPKSHLTQVVQKVDLEVTKDGIRADAETVAGVVYGGILSAPKPFHMFLDRPFVFLIRDQVTNALILLGAFMDPADHP
jgi:serine protease inhibitor